MIRIVSKKEGFRRCGISHTVAPVDYPDNRWSAEEMARLQAEPTLVVTILKSPAPTAVVKDMKATLLDKSYKAV